jgi:hypothetical protein
VPSDDELMAFALDAAFASLEGREGAPLDEAAAALDKVDESKVDVRDLIVARDVVGWAREPTGRESGGMWRRVKTPEGPRLFVDYGARFRPRIDLLAAAHAIRDVLERDTYRVQDIAVGGHLPDVWLADGVTWALHRIRACMMIEAQPGGDPADDLGTQQFTVFLVEAANEKHARLLADAAVSKDWHEAFGVAHGRACAVTVARSWVDGVPPLERPGDLERFREPFARALERAV